MDDRKEEKKEYSPPKLENHGRIERLTTGGSGMSVEMVGGMVAPNKNFP
jgi:hypothetical protein